MEITEIVLLVIGVGAFIASFVIPERKNRVSAADQRIGKEKIHEMVEAEMQGVQTRISASVDETVRYAMEKTERSMERLSNEKIMEVNEYSDTVMNEIHRNHEEVVFLYDMLNDKHKNMTMAAAEVEKKAQEAVKTVEKKAEESVVTVEKKAVETAFPVGDPQQETRQEASLEPQDQASGLARLARAQKEKQEAKEKRSREIAAEETAMRAALEGAGKPVNEKEEPATETMGKERSEERSEEIIASDPQIAGAVEERLEKESPQEPEASEETMSSDPQIAEAVEERPEKESPQIPEASEEVALGEKPQTQKARASTSESEKQAEGAEAPVFEPMATDTMERIVLNPDGTVDPKETSLPEESAPETGRQSVKAGKEAFVKAQKDAGSKMDVDSVRSEEVPKRGTAKSARSSRTGKGRGRSASSIREATLMDFIVNKPKTASEEAKKEPADSVTAEPGMQNNNDRILALHKSGKSNVAIAKELGLGVGEVNLVIGLFKGN